MSQFEQLDKMVQQNRGVLRTSEVLSEGISKTALAKYVELHELERVSHGIYLAPDAWADSMYLLQLRCKQIVFSHDTALFLHDMTDRVPMQYTVTVKTGYNPSRLKADGVKVYTIKKELYDLGIVKLTTSFGHTVVVYDPERTVCDIVRSRNNIEAQTFQEALKLYVRRRDKSLQKLMQYSKEFHVDKILNQYLGVLL